MKAFKKDIFNYLILLIVPIISFADFDNSNPEISNVFSRGPVLVYDCNGRNTVCASERSFKYCSGYNPKESPCKIIKRFDNESDCKALQLQIVSDSFDGDFCKQP